MADRGPVIRPGDGGDRETRQVYRGLHYDEPPPWFDPTTNNPTVIEDNSIVKKPIKRDPKGRTLVLNAQGQIVPVIYGPAQAGAKVPWAVTVGPYLYIMFVVGEGPLESITELGFGDSQETTFARLGLVAGTDYNVYLGTASQGVDPIFAGIDSDWVWKFPGTAYVTAKLNINTENMDQVDVTRFRCKVKGRQVVDVRVDPTMADASRAYSDNPALCLLDFTMARRFGLGADISEVNLDSFGESADDCDVITTSAVAAPSTAPTTTVGGTGSGQVENGTFQHAISFFDSSTGLESLLGPWSSDLTTTLAGLGQFITLSSVETSGALWRKVYRRKKNPDGSTYGPAKEVLVTPYDSSTTTYNDFRKTADLGKSPADETDIRQFRLSMVVDSAGETCGQTIDTMRQCFASNLVFNNGRFQSFVDKVRDPTAFSFGPENVRELITIHGRDPAQIPSQVVVNFTDVAGNGAPRSVTFPVAPPITEGDSRSDRNIQTFDLLWIPSFDQAMRVAIWIWKRLNRPYSLSGTVLQVGALPVPGSVVPVSQPRAGIPSTDVIITSLSPTPDRIYWDWTGEPFDADDYDLDYHSDDNSVPPVHDPPDPPEPPTSLALSCVQIDSSGTPAVRIDIGWTPADMPYETSTIVQWSVDNFASDVHELGIFTGGAATLWNTELGTEYFFRLATVRVSNGQLSDYLTGDIIATFNDPSIPEVTQAAFPWPAASLAANELECYGPLSLQRRDEILPPAPTVSPVATSSGLAMTVGTHEIAVAVVYPWGEGHMGARATVTIGTDERASVTNIVPSPPADGLEYKLYVGDAGVTGGTLYYASRGALSGPSSDIVSHDDSTHLATLAQPTGMNGFKAWEVFCTNPIHGSEAPLVVDPRLRNMPPIRQNPIDCTSHVHEDPSDHAPRIDVLIRVVDMNGGISTGVTVSKHPAAWGVGGPPISVPTSVAVVDGINEDLDIPVDANLVYLTDGGLTADFSIGGFTVAGSTPGLRKRITFLNMTGFRGSFEHESGGSTAGNRLVVPGLSTYDFGATHGSATIEYDTDNSRWKPIANNSAGFGPTAGSGFGSIWNQHPLVQHAGFNIDDTGVVGVLGQQCRSIALVDGNNDDVDTPGGLAAGSVQLTTGFPLTGATTIRSMLNHGNLPGTMVFLWNNCGFPVTLTHQWGGASTGAQFYSPTGADAVLSAATGSCALLMHDDNLGSWIIVTIN